MSAAARKAAVAAALVRKTAPGRRTHWRLAVSGQRNPTGRFPAMSLKSRQTQLDGGFNRRYDKTCTAGFTLQRTFAWLHWKAGVRPQWTPKDVRPDHWLYAVKSRRDA
jgi:hypothetical protein